MTAHRRTRACRDMSAAGVSRRHNFPMNRFTRLSRAVAIVAATLVMASVVSFAAPPQACACSCQTWATPQEAVQAFNTIFVGVPIRETTEDNYYLYEVEVSAVYTGDVAAKVTVSTPTEGTACGATIRLDKDRLFFVNSGSDPTRFGATSCGPSTGQSFDAKAVAEELYGEPRSPAPAAPTASEAAGASESSAGSDSTVTVVAVVAGVAVLAAVGVALMLWIRRRQA